MSSGLQDVTINSNFASLSEAMYIAERKAAEDIYIRNQIRKKMALKEKADKEEELREMASRARMERAGVVSVGDSSELQSYYQQTQLDDARNVESAVERDVRKYHSDDEGEPSDSHSESAHLQRVKLRIERRKEREREFRSENMKVHKHVYMM